MALSILRRNLAWPLLALALTFALGCGSVPFLGGSDDAELSAEGEELPDGAPEGDGVLVDDSLQEALAGGEGSEETLALPPFVLRVFRNERENMEVLFDQPVKLEGGEIYLRTSKGALSRAYSSNPAEYGYSLEFDIDSLEEGGEVVVLGLEITGGGLVRTETGKIAQLDFEQVTLEVDRRLFGSSVSGSRPYVVDISASDWSVTLEFSEEVRFDETLRLRTRSAAGQVGEAPLNWQSLQVSENQGVAREITFEVPESFRSEPFWLAPLHVYGFSPAESITSARNPDLPARRWFEVFSLQFDRGLLLDDTQRCAYLLAEGDPARYGLAVDNLGSYLEQEGSLADETMRNECLLAVARLSVGVQSSGLARNWESSACLDQIESAYRMAQFYPGRLDAGYPGVARDRWLRVDELVSRPYDLLTLEERLELRSYLTGETCPEFYPQLFYGYWFED